MLRTAKLLRLKAKSAVILPDKLVKMSFPAILKTTAGYYLILKTDKEKSLVINEENGVLKICVKYGMEKSYFLFQE